MARRQLSTSRLVAETRSVASQGLKVTLHNSTDLSKAAQSWFGHGERKKPLQWREMNEGVEDGKETDGALRRGIEQLESRQH